jgi:hypothetical protein
MIEMCRVKVPNFVGFIRIASCKLNSNLFCMNPISTSSFVMKNQPSPPNSHTTTNSLKKKGRKEKKPNLSTL